ncbi:MAG: ABC transporter permease [Bacteroidetes bacterium]|nr:ABC transporter permease [Bacteroidota bacterium]
MNKTVSVIGMYMGIAVMLALSVGFGLALGMAMSAPRIEDIQVLLLLMLTGVLLSFIFSGLAFLIAIATRDKLRGIGMALSLWLFMAVIYDGLMLMYFIVFSEYPIEEHAIILSLLNPIDLSRIFIMLQLDVSALMGYSGAVFQKFFGTGLGVGVSIGAMLLWIVVPQFLFVYRARRKDF